MRLVLHQPARIPRIKGPKRITYSVACINVIYLFLYYYLVISLVIFIGDDCSSTVCKDMLFYGMHFFPSALYIRQGFLVSPSFLLF